MLREDDVVGAIVIYRKEVRRFDDREIALIKDFAAQAVIAIENARLLNELRQRTTDLTEALEQQTATSEVLQVISASPGDLEPVFISMLQNAVRICDAKFGSIYRWTDGALSAAMTRGEYPDLPAKLKKPVPHSRVGPRRPDWSRLHHSFAHVVTLNPRGRDVQFISCFSAAHERQIVICRHQQGFGQHPKPACQCE